VSVTVAFRSLDDGVCLFVRLSLLASCLWTQKYSAVLLVPDVSEISTLGVTQQLIMQAVKFFELCSRNKQFKSPSDHRLSWL